MTRAEERGSGTGDSPPRAGDPVPQASPPPPLPPLLLDLAECVGIWLGRQSWYSLRRLNLRAPAHRQAPASPLAHAYHRLPEHTQELETHTEEDEGAVALVRPYLLVQQPRRAELLPGPRQTRQGAADHA
ncbi:MULTISPECIES: hypothetical protein [unclassified Streptomyces]|uniref:hypothetical protein n=1 Tax=unclassified Streptomyces TaxID=2593676 RepID=UPI002DDC3EF5|nr:MULTISPECIES: hypothetical protein [unclassified Streptomyces]WSS46751.1 hypothetical protein OG220_39915 [Streptomyces sp. NBC_01187]WSA97732.1 hypothetical protein OIE63_40305 [Streptomyces sp. NBC_01795]WSB82018.1 hypothetical protein OHB04_40515 [Streptomyces sp. NBC_01775]WSS17993.1 hypothetical protein OG533_39620 [Streptomyces sp. NBC_01186]WSS47032.1 hypothetical protein OG220_41710 [Streptomyces sp. NBC_01187]